MGEGFEMAIEKINLNIELPEDEAEALSQFVKRVGVEDLKKLAQNEREAYLMLNALLKIQKELEYKGFAPR